MIELDPILLARLQFAFTVTFHIIFPAISIGLAAFLAVLEWRYLKTDDVIYRELYKFWVKIFAIVFAMGVVSGVVMAYQFGTNWSNFSKIAGNVIGPLMGYEVLTAFFLEASFLGIMLFGWGRVTRKMHFASTVIVAVGTLISAFWILSVNSWMQTPTGYSIDADGIFQPANWMEIIFNPSFGYRFVHMVIAAYITTAFLVGAVTAYYQLKNRYAEHCKITIRMFLLMIAIAAPLQVIVGDLHGLNTLQHQPQKVAAMEGIWENETGAALRLFALPNEETEQNDFEIAIPGLASLILVHDINGEVKGLKNWPASERPPVNIVFWSFRVMVGIGILMLITAIWGVVLYFKGKLDSTRAYQKLCFFMAPSGVIAIIAGWVVTEVGRQPYTVYGLLRTADSTSPILAPQIAWSLLAFIVVYGFIFSAASFYVIRHIRRGIDWKGMQPFGSHGVKAPVILGQDSTEGEK